MAKQDNERTFIQRKQCEVATLEKHRFITLLVAVAIYFHSDIGGNAAVKLRLTSVNFALCTDRMFPNTLSAKCSQHVLVVNGTRNLDNQQLQ